MVSMKRVLRSVAVALLALVLSMSAMAQTTHDVHDHDHDHDHAPKLGTEWGVGIGGVYSMLDYSSEAVQLNPRIGYEGHLHMGLLIGRSFAVEVELCYSGGSVVAKHAASELERKIRTTTIDVPVLLSLRVFGGRLQFDLGPTFTVRSSAEYTLESDTQFFGPLYPTWNLTAGVGVRLFGNLMLDVRYTHPLADTHNHFVGNEFKMRTRRATAGLTLMF